MRYIQLFLLVILPVFFTSSCKGQQSKLLIKQELFTDLPSTPIYPRLTRNVNGEIVWKEQFEYLDIIDIYRITYMSDGLKINGLMVKPKRKGKFPCVIFNRGGNRDFGALKIAHGAITMGNIAKEGYVVIASQYRGNSGSEGQEEFGGSDVNDITILPEVLKEIEEADTDKIGMYGWSRGGMMTYIALTKMDNIKAVAVGGAISDLTVIERPGMETGVYEELIPNYKKNKKAELEKRSAIKWVDKFPKNIPILLLHGNSDWRVKSSNSLRLALEFDEHRIPYRLKIFEGSDHGISEFKTEANNDVINWFNKYLRDNESLPNMEYHGN